MTSGLAMGFSSECRYGREAHHLSARLPLTWSHLHEVLEHYWGEHIHMGADRSETSSETTLAIPAGGVLLKSFGSEKCLLLVEFTSHAELLYQWMIGILPDVWPRCSQLQAPTIPWIHKVAIGRRHVICDSVPVAV